MIVTVEDSFQYCPQCGQPNPAPGAVPFRCPHCGMALYLGPVAAVAALIADEDDRLLLVRRARDPGKGKWGLPGGFVDRKETIEQALAREVFEETQLVVTGQQLLMTHPNQYAYAGVLAPVIDLFYACQVEAIDKLQLAADELESYEWTWPSDDHLSDMAFESNRVAVEHWMKGLS